MSKLKPHLNLIPLYLTNSFVVFNDNLLKGLISLIAVYWVLAGNESIVIMAATAFMVLPFIIFAPFAGYLSKVLIKRNFVIKLKLLELTICIVAIVGFYLSNIYIVLVAMFMLGLQSNFFSPMKFALVRDIGGEENSSIGTGTLEMTTFFGVLVGTFFAGFITDINKYRLEWIAIVLLLACCIGLVTAILVKAKEPKPLKLKIIPMNFMLFLIRRIKWSRRNAPGLNTVVVGLSFFWMIGSLLQMNLFVHLPITMGLSAFKTGIILASVAVSIGLGSVVSGLIAKKRIAIELIPIGGSLFILTNLLIFILNPEETIFFILISLAAFLSGIFKTPLNAWMQVYVKGRQLGDAIAYNNLMNFIFILVSAGIFALVERFFGSIYVFLVVAVISIIMILFLCAFFYKNVFKRN